MNDAAAPLEARPAHQLMTKHQQHTIELILYGFLLTFAASRILVYLIMDHQIPDLYLHVGGNHVHHLNYGIFLLSGVGAYLLILRPHGPAETLATIIYSIGLGLTFDEFGMWYHLGGAYWQRASFDAVVMIAGLLALGAVVPSAVNWTWKRWLQFGVLLLVLLAFGYNFRASLAHAKEKLVYRLHTVEQESPQ